MIEKICAIVLVVEGDTDKYFYDSFLDKFEYRRKLSNIEFKIINVKGIGNFKKDSLRKCEYYLLHKKKKDIPTYIFLCYDSDIFTRKFAQNPPFDYDNLKKGLSKLQDVQEVYNIIAEESIEDWFLFDLESVCKYLNIRSIQHKALKGNSGEDKLKHLFKKADKVYNKGSNPDSGKFIDSLNLDLIIKQNEELFEKFNNILSTYG
ncbi:MAG: hypothetical protein FWE29_00920 [Defluviitaleaceae bacterium]|nr:hypothetical protein [Defluviitaleaceae bacterium]